MRQFRWETTIPFKLTSTLQTLLRELALEKFGETYFSAENNFGAPFAPKVITQNIKDKKIIPH